MERREFLRVIKCLCFVLTLILCFWKADAQYQRQMHGIARAAPPALIRKWTVFTGRRVVLNCSIDLPPEIDPRQVQYRWERPEGNPVGYSKLYVIPNVSLSDGGMYVCHSTAYSGYSGQQWSMKHRLHLDVKQTYNLQSPNTPYYDRRRWYDQVGDGDAYLEEDLSVAGYHPDSPPTIILTPGTPGPLEVSEGDDLTSRCSVLEQEPFTFRWIRRMPDGRSEEMSSNYILALYQVTHQDLEYPIYCLATREADGQTFEQLLNLKVAQRLTVDIRPLTPEVTVGKPYEMICEVTPKPPGAVNYRWFHAGRMVGEGELLQIPSLAYPDIGTYVCRAEWFPADARSGPIAANTTLEINLALTREMGIEMSPKPGSIMVTLPGETRELHCEFHQIRDSQSIRWYFENQPLESHPTVNASGLVHRVDRLRVSIVILRGVEAAHAGSYECHVNGDVKQTHVVVRLEDTLEINPSSDTVDEGSPVEFHCQAHGSARRVNREMQWFYRPFFGGSIVPLDFGGASGFVRQDDTYAQHTSFIQNQRVRKSDEGEYICRLGGNEARGRLMVREPSRFRVHITPQIIRVRAYQPIEIECYITEETGRPVTFVPQYRADRPVPGFITSPMGENRLRISNPNGLAAEYNGTRVECYTDRPGEPASAIIVIETTCPQGYRRCRSGQCIPAGQFCDGQFDCLDRSDEDPIFCKACDPISKPCEDYRGRPPHKKNYMIHWECDGEDDCGNGYDESRCPDPSVARCDGSMFNCGQDGRSIPLSYVCDGDMDCPGGRDEFNCATPVIQSSSTYRFPTRVGGTVQLTCRVTGQPIPRVIWRFNWGCLPDEGGRFRVTSMVENCQATMPTVISTLTITGVQNGDDGIYNCEALAGPARSMSNDFFVMLE